MKDGCWHLRQPDGQWYPIPVDVPEMREEIAACGFAVPIPQTAVTMRGSTLTSNEAVVCSWRWMREQQVERNRRGGQ